MSAASGPASAASISLLDPSQQPPPGGGDAQNLPAPVALIAFPGDQPGPLQPVDEGHDVTAVDAQPGRNVLLAASPPRPPPRWRSPRSRRPAAGSRPACARSSTASVSSGDGGTIQGAFAIDLNATIFGLPRALFPALAATVFGGGQATLGLLYAAPGAGALIGALTTGWVGRVPRQGRAVIIAVIVWGTAITGSGLTRWLPGGLALPAALALLAAAGWADVISSVFRSTIVPSSRCPTPSAAG